MNILTEILNDFDQFDTDQDMQDFDDQFDPADVDDLDTEIFEGEL